MYHLARDMSLMTLVALEKNSDKTAKKDSWKRQPETVARRDNQRIMPEETVGEIVT